MKAIQLDNSAKTFPSNAHRIGWYLSSGLLPFEPCVAADASAREAEIMREGQRALHAFFTRLYADMLENPSVYRMDEIEDLTFENGEWYKHRPEMKKVTARNAHVLKSLEVLFLLVQAAEREQHNFVLSAKRCEDILAGVMPKSVSRPKMKSVLSAMERCGLTVSLTNDVVLAAPENPCMIDALKAMTAYASDEDLSLRVFAMYRCDFAAVNAEYAPDLAGVFQVLSETDRKSAETVLSHMVDQGYRPDFRMGGYPSAMWRVAFAGNRRLKSGDFFWLSFSIEYLNRLGISLHCINPLNLIPLARQKGDAYQSWFSDQWRQGCNGCGYCKGKFKEPGPYVIEVNGKKRGLCHQNWMEIRGPLPEQVDNVLRMVDLHSEAGMAPAG